MACPRALRVADEATAKKHYAEHEDKPFFGELVDFITSRGYRKATTRVPSARALSDSLLIPEIQRVHAENFSVYGNPKPAWCLRTEVSAH